VRPGASGTITTIALISAVCACRVALLGGCRHWRHALLAAPQLLLTAVLKVPPPAVLQREEYCPACAADYSEAQAALMQAAGLSRLAWRLRLASRRGTQVRQGGGWGIAS